MKIFIKYNVCKPSVLLAAFFSVFSANVSAQVAPTPVPTVFSDWTGAADSNFFNAANWSTNAVPNSPTAAIRLRSDSAIAHKNIDMFYTGTGNARYQFYSIQTGAPYLYTINLAGTENGWLEFNPIGKGFTFNGLIGTTPESGSGNDITNPDSTGNDSTRNPVYVVLNSYSRLVCDDSYSSMRVLNNGLAQAIFTLKGNAEIDISNAGRKAFIKPDGTSNAAGALTIGGVIMEKGTVFNTGSFSGELRLNGKGQVGQVLEMGGLIEATTALDLRIYGSGVTWVTGTVNNPLGNVRIEGSQSEYVVDGAHYSKSLAINQTGNAVGGSGHIYSNVTVAKGVLTPGMRGTASSTPLTITGSVSVTEGKLSFDLITATSYDQLIINGNLSISEKASLAIGRAETFPLVPGTYTLMTVNGNIAGDFLDTNVGLPFSMSLRSSWRWLDHNLQVVFEQLPFASNSELTGMYRTIAERVDVVAGDNMAPPILLDTLNRQPSIMHFKNVLYQLGPNSYQAWFPSAIFRTNSMVQNVEDMMYQDAAFKRKKNSMQLFAQAYRQEASRAKNEMATYSNYNTEAIIAGLDYAIGAEFTAGAFVLYEKTLFDLDTAGGNSNEDSYTVGLKARYNTGNFQFNVTGFYGTDDYDSERTVAATKIASWAKSETSGSRYGAAASLAYTYKHPWLEITPAVGAQWLNWSVDAFHERDAKEANLYVYGQKETSLQSKVGVRIARSFKTKAGMIRPFFHYAWIHEFDNDTRTLSAKLFNGRINIDAPGSNSDGYRIDIGFDWNATEKLRFELRYASENRGSADESRGVRGGMTYTF